MAEIFTEIIVLKKYKFCDELWSIIKDYMGVHGIKLYIPKMLYDIGLQKLANVMHTTFRLKVIIPNEIKRAELKKKLMLCALYKKYNTLDKDKKMLVCDLTNDYLNGLKFKVPEWLKINDSIRIYIKNNGIWSKVGKVITISKSSFTVKYDDDTIQIIKSNIYSRII